VASAGGTVTIGCKLPNGFFMQVYRLEDITEPVLGGGLRQATRGVAMGTPFKIFGTAVPHGQRPPFVIAGGYALTPNVPADLATAWFEQNKESAMVVNKVVFMHEKGDSAQRMGKELGKDTRSGLEPLDVGVKNLGEGRMAPRDPRWPARVNPNLSQVGTDLRDDTAVV
jgi:hypothetical protein